MPKVLTSLLTNAIIGYKFAQNGKNVSEKPHDKRFFEVHFCLQLQPTRPVGDETPSINSPNLSIALQPTRPVGDETCFFISFFEAFMLQPTRPVGDETSRN